MTEPRSPFHPLRFVDLWVENWKKSVVTFGTFIVALWTASEVYDVTGSAALWTAVVIGILALQTSITPRWTMYGRPIGIAWNGCLYRRLVSRLRANHEGET